MTNEENLLIDHYFEEHKNIFLVEWNFESLYSLRKKSVSKKNSINNPNSANYIDLDIIKKFIDQVINHYNNKNIVFEFTGGELSPYNYFYNILKYLKKRKCKTSIKPNVMLNNDYWKKIIDVLDFITLKYSINYCPFEKFYSIIRYLQKNVMISLNLIIPLKNFEDFYLLTEKLLESFKNILINFQFKKKLNENDFSKDQLNKIHLLKQKSVRNSIENKSLEKWYRGLMIKYDKNGNLMNNKSQNELFPGNENNYNSWLCWSGLEKIVIKEDGEIFSAWCFNNYLGNIKNKIIFPTIPIICPGDKCIDTLDQKIRKQRLVCFKSKDITNLSKIGIF